MIKIAVGIVAVLLCSCYQERQIQVDMVGAELVKIDTVYRYTGSEQLLIWKCANNVEYVSYAPINRLFILGSRMVVMVRR